MYYNFFLTVNSILLFRPSVRNSERVRQAIKVHIISSLPGLLMSKTKLSKKKRKKKNIYIVKYNCCTYFKHTFMNLPTNMQYLIFVDPDAS